MKKYLLLSRDAAVFYPILRQYGYEPIAILPDGSLNVIVASHADTRVFVYRRHIVTDRSLAAVLSEKLPDESVVATDVSDASTDKNAIVNNMGAASTDKNAIVNNVSAASTDGSAVSVNGDTAASDGYDITVAADTPFGNYPNDIRFQALVMNGHFYARKNALSAEIYSIMSRHHLSEIPVKQGYTRCSVLSLPCVNRAVTSDTGICRALQTNGITVLPIRSGDIALTGCDYGFIGGSSFVDEDSRTVYFFGNLMLHSDGAKIAAFLHDGGYTAVSLSENQRLTDYGGAAVFTL